MGEPIPDRIENAPTLDVGMDFYINAFFELSSDRSAGFGEGPIPTMSILSYCKHYSILDEDESDFMFFIRKLDETYLKYRNSKKK